MFKRAKESVWKSAYEQQTKQAEHVKEIVTAGNCLIIAYPKKLKSTCLNKGGNHAGNYNILKFCLTCKCPKRTIHMKQIQDKNCSNYTYWQEVRNWFYEILRNCRYGEVISHQQRNITCRNYTYYVVNNKCGSSIKFLHIKNFFHHNIPLCIYGSYEICLPPSEFRSGCFLATRTARANGRYI